MYFAKAVPEILGIHHQLPTLAPVIQGDSEVTDYIRQRFSNMRVAGSGLFGSALHDIATLGEADPTLRKEVAISAAQMTLVQDIADEVVDTDMSGESNELRFEYLARLGAVLTGERPDHDPDPNLRRRASFHMAELLHDSFLHKDTTGLTGVTIGRLIKSAEAQFLATTPTELLHIAKVLGADCIGAIAIMPEIAESTEFPDMRRAAWHIGAYCELVDHAFELDEDLVEGSSTYATLRIKNEGDNPLVRKDIRDVMKTEAREVRREGAKHLTRFQKSRYNGLLNFVDFKFKVADRKRFKKAYHAKRAGNDSSTINTELSAKHN